MRGIFFFFFKNQSLLHLMFVFMNMLCGLSIQASNMRKITKCVMKVSEADKPIQIFKITSFGKSLSNSLFANN